MAESAAHPYRASALGLASVGAGCFAFTAWTGHSAPAAFGVLFVGWGGYVEYAGGLSHRLTLVSGAIHRGELAAARAELARLRARPHLAVAHRLLDHYEAELAWAAGDPAGMRRHVDAARTRRVWLPLWGEGMDGRLTALRALACAALGEEEEARASIAEAQNVGDASVAARVELADAMLVKDDLDELRRRLERHHVLWHETLDRRSREIHRELRQTLTARASAPYRGSDNQRLRPTRPDSPRRPRQPQIMPVWFVLFALYVAGWLLFVGGESLMDFRGLLRFAVVPVVSLFVARRLQRRRNLRIAEQASIAIARGDLVHAEVLAEWFEDDGRLGSLFAAMLWGAIHERRGKLEDASTAYQAALELAVLQRDLRRIPELRATCARVLAALGRDADSQAELARLERQFPHDPRLASYRLSVGLLSAARRGDLAEARRLAESRGDLVLGPYVEGVAELVLLDGAERHAHFRHQLTLMPQIEEWIRASLPGFLERALPEEP